MEAVMHKSPLEGDTRERDQDWVVASQRMPDFVSVDRRNPVLTASKLRLMQKYVWVALFRAVEQRATRDREGRVVAGGWQRTDMLGMFDWYRACFKLPAWWWPSDTDTAEVRRRNASMHADGIWLTVLNTSPWWNCPWLARLREQNRGMRIGPNGRLVLDVNGLPAYENSRHCSDEKAQEFLDTWERIANSWMVLKDGNGDPVLPYLTWPSSVLPTTCFLLPDTL